MGFALALTKDKDKSIITEFQNGNTERAASEFVREYQSFVFSTALRYLKSRDDAYDAAQEVFIKALKNIGSFRNDSSLSTWLYRITINVCHGMNRKKKLRTFVGLEAIEFFAKSNETSPEQVAVNNDFQAQFELILAELPEKQRETFVLRYFQELSYEEISRMLGTTVGGLKANYFQAAKKIATRISTEKNYE